VQYFACEPKCGIFVPAGKLVRVATSAETDRSELAASRIDPGSRAGKYLNMTADQLRSSASSATSTHTDTSITPRPSRIAPRGSFGLPSSSIPTTPASSGPRRKSLGATPATPRLSLKRPSSRASVSEYVPPVPSLPSANSSSAAALASGRTTPSLATNSRRSSHIDNDNRPQSARPQTPSTRSLSRQSFSSSIGRPQTPATKASSTTARNSYPVPPTPSSGRNSVTGGGWARPPSRLAAEREEFERVERERDDARKELAEAQHRLEVAVEAERSAASRVAEQEQAKQRVEAELAQANESLTAAREAAASSGDELKLELSKAQASLAEAKEAESKAKAELADVKAEVTRLTEENESLSEQLAQLREAGQSLCAVYEERISASEAERLAAVEARLAVEAELGRLKTSSSSMSLASRAGVRSGEPGEAEMIETENLREDVEHFRARASALDEQLAETRSQLEKDAEEREAKRLESEEVEMGLRREVKHLKDVLGTLAVLSIFYLFCTIIPSLTQMFSPDRTARAENRATARAAELESALSENRSALENERAELEHLRAEAANSDTVELHRQLADERKRADDLAEELRLMEELRDDDDAFEEPPTPTRSSWGRTARSSDSNDSGEGGSGVVARLRQELKSRDVELRSLRRQVQSSQQHQPQLAHPPTNMDSSTPPPSLSPTNTTSNKRDSTASSTSSRRSLGSVGRDEVSQMREQIVGLKVIISQLTEENNGVTAQNKMLVHQAEELRFVVLETNAYVSS
jgi:CAP-Gly domain-containing linker protein 1